VVLTPAGPATAPAAAAAIAAVIAIREWEFSCASSRARNSAFSRSSSRRDFFLRRLGCGWDDVAVVEDVDVEVEKDMEEVDVFKVAEGADADAADDDAGGPAGLAFLKPNCRA